MIHARYTRPWGALAIALSLLLSACAQQIDDIDRTQPNRLLKSELTATQWFMAQTVTEVPTTSMFTFIGETSTMERVRWEIREDMIIAYRAYPRLERSDPGVEAEGDAYTENPIAAFPVMGHFDIQRAFNTATGEQSNVLIENYSDRPWFERDYVRVDWSRNMLVNFDFIAQPANVMGLSYFVPEEQGGPDALVREVDDQGKLSYFDFVGKVLVEPDFWGCLFTYYNWSAEDCTSAEIKVRTSFMRAEPLREYEPVSYSDRLMSKFGYFRTERFGFDPWRGVRQTNRVLLANRHPIWEKVWARDADGAPRRDADNALIALPMSERSPKPIVYYASETMPDEIFETSQTVANSWDLAMRTAVAAAQGKSPEEVGRMYAVCHNPVQTGDEPACGEVGLRVRMGDIRYNHMVWVDRYTQAGLLGYGPSGADPLTGEIVFGAAYVYGAEVDVYAQSSADMVRLLRGDLTDEDLKVPDYIRDEIRDRLSDDPARPRVNTARAPGLRALRPTSDVTKLVSPKKATRLRAIKRQGLERSSQGQHQRRMEALRQANLDMLLQDDEQLRGRSRGRYSARQAPPQEVAQKLRPGQWASASHMNLAKQRMQRAARHNLYLTAFADDAIVGLARELQDQDPETVRHTLRRAIYRAVMEHEVGHTLGLRHNFQGSYDALNFHDSYWQLRKETIKLDPTMDEMYAMSAPTEAQKNGKMQQLAYSSIMDYGMRFNSDIEGIGKYDIAAILFGYSAGTYDQAVGPEPGYVYTYDEPGNALGLLRSYEDPDSLAYDSLLEQHHYSSVALAFPSIEAMQARSLVRYDKLKQQRAAAPRQAPVEVPFMFCSDEWVGALVSCQLFDAGADPFEIVKNTADMYRDYYTWNHWARDRAFFWSEDVLNSMYSRYFSQLTHVYQQWVFAYFNGTSDEVLDNYYIFAALTAFNALADVLQVPSPGSYNRGADGVYRISDYTLTGQAPNTDLFVSMGAGREVFSEYHYESGYYLFDRIDHVGHFWDYLGALFALTDSEATRLGVDTSADEVAFSIPWFLFFEGELTEMFGGIFTRNAGVFAPRVVNGQVVRRPMALLGGVDAEGQPFSFDPATGAQVSEEVVGEPLELDTSYTQELYAVMYGMAFFTSNFSLNFPDQWRVFRVGSGEALTAGAGFEVVSFADPSSGITYGALQSTDPSAPRTGAALLLNEANRWAQIARTSADEDEVSEAQFRVQDMVDRINLSRSMYDVLGTTF